MKKLISAVLMLALFCALLPGGQALAEEPDEVWVVNTETVQDLQTGETTVWQHSCTVDENGRLIEDAAAAQDGSGSEIVERWRYDENGNCVWHVTARNTFVITGGWGSAVINEYDEQGRLTLMLYCEDLDLNIWRAVQAGNYDPLITEDDAGDPALYESAKDCAAFFAQYACEESVRFDDHEETRVFFPSWGMQYEYDGSGAQVSRRRLDIRSGGNYEYTRETEQTEDGYTVTDHIFQNGEPWGELISGFDGDGNEIRREARNARVEVQYSYRMRYDEDGRLLEQEYEGYGSSHQRESRSYDENGCCIRKETFDLTLSATEPCRIVEYTYKAATD